MTAPPSQIAPHLIAAYEATRYDVDGQIGAPVHFYSGDPSPGLDALLKKAGVTEAAFLTAYNPASAPLCESENRARNEALAGDLARRGLPVLLGHGRDPAGIWTAEPSFLVLGLSRADASALETTYGQNAFVHVCLGAPPALILLR